MTTNAAGLTGFLAVAALWSGAAAAQPSPTERVVLAPHRAVYDLVLDAGKAAKNVDSARGRIAFDFTGDACEGYALSFRQVTQLQSGEGGPRLIDARTTSFEAGDGASYRFKTESSASGTPKEIVDGTATRTGEGYEVVALVWRPMQMSPVHAHRTWCAFGVHRGILTEHYYDAATLRPHAASLRCEGDTCHGPADPSLIHRLGNCGAECATSIHVYGAAYERFGEDVNLILG